jgi:hypothetical protein
MRQDEIDRCLILVFESRNNAIYANYSMPFERMDRFCRVPEAKADLIKTLLSLADHIERNYPHD